MPTTPSAIVSSSDLEQLATTLRGLVDIRDRRYGVTRTLFENCFVGSEATTAMVEAGIAADRDDAVRLGNLLLEAGVFRHVQDAHPFRDDYLFYRFAGDADHGKVAARADGSTIQWADFLPGLGDVGADSLQADIPPPDENLGNLAQADLEAIGVAPLDAHNARLLDNVRPKAWRNPAPKPRYNLVAVGAGAGGLISSGIVAGMGGTAALIESHLLGGDCLNVGCVPSKALISSARVAHQMRQAAHYGVHVDGEVRVDFGAVMERMRRLRADISPADSARRYADEKGVDVFIGHGRFTGADRIEVDGQTLAFSKAVIATGGTAAIPDIPGLQSAPYLTNASVFNLTELPARLVVIGAGPIGLELAQAFQRFGASVVVMTRSAQILPREDREAAELVKRALQADGVGFEHDCNYERVDTDPATGLMTLHFSQHGQARQLETDGLLIATGRKPNVTGLGLDAAGVEFDPRQGVKVDDRLRTTNPNIFAVGDVATRYQFTHVADFMARIAVRNAVAYGSERFSRLLIPWATFTDPEVAHVGLYESDLVARDIPFTTFRKDFHDVDRAIVDGATNGFVKIHVRKGRDQILGATVVGHGAGDLISEISVAIQAGMGLGKLANVIHPYPTVADALRACGDSYNSSRLTPTVRMVLNRLMAFQR